MRYYIQLKKRGVPSKEPTFGFYHLFEDKYNLGTIQFDGQMQLRLRCKKIKTMKRGTPEEYISSGFIFVMKIASSKIKKMTPSKFCLIESYGRKLPV